MPARFAPILFAFFLSGIMSLVVCSVATLRAMGLVDGFLAQVTSSWLFSWAVAFPVVMVVAPFVRKLVGRIVKT